jgi:indole-3-glycerol phosphate synthase
MSDILARIVARKHAEVAERRERVPDATLAARVRDMPPARGFAQALRRRIAAGRAAVIAEIKKASPSKGVLRADFHPADIARRYAAHGAACLSVLTDHDFFQGHENDLVAARAACELPVLRKDFTVDPYQVFEARALGADAVLLIVAALDAAELRALHDLAQSLGMDVLMEVHDQGDMERALRTPAALIGINNRNLRNFEVSLDTTRRLAPQVGAERVVVAESGISTSDDVASLRVAGVHAFLVGEAFMRAADPGAALSELFG